MMTRARRVCQKFLTKCWTCGSRTIWCSSSSTASDLTPVSTSRWSSSATSTGFSSSWVWTARSSPASSQWKTTKTRITTRETSRRRRGSEATRRLHDGASKVPRSLAAKGGAAASLRTPSQVAMAAAVELAAPKAKGVDAMISTSPMAAAAGVATKVAVVAAAGTSAVMATDTKADEAAAAVVVIRAAEAAEAGTKANLTAAAIKAEAAEAATGAEAAEVAATRKEAAEAAATRAEAEAVEAESMVVGMVVDAVDEAEEDRASSHERCRRRNQNCLQGESRLPRR
mmetsp:Transcript_50458/g.141218  ORF Transcript_50458/g.141218 Transcript_50458/m.141218 type:complete len:285 (+) Transcript_50458:232-1086(+)